MSKFPLPASAAAVLRDRIREGALPPGTPLREVALAADLGVSRNTLREALRDLLAEGLIAHHPHRGATVRVLTPDEIREIYTIRMTLELRGIDCSAYAPPAAMARLAGAVDSVQRAAATEDWRAVGTASLAFHRGVVGFIGSPRLDTLFATVTAQTRLAFALTGEERAFQSRWPTRDREICDLLCSAQREAAARAMVAYLRESERIVLEALRPQSLPPRRPLPQTGEPK